MLHCKFVSTVAMLNIWHFRTELNTVGNQAKIIGIHRKRAVFLIWQKILEIDSSSASIYASKENAVFVSRDVPSNYLKTDVPFPYAGYIRTESQLT